MPLTTDTTDHRRFGGTEACPHDRHDGSQEVRRHGGVPLTTDNRRSEGPEWNRPEGMGFRPCRASQTEARDLRPSAFPRLCVIRPH